MREPEKKGCQLIELEELDKIVGWPGCQTIAVAVLSWIADTIQREQASELAGAQLRVIVAAYLGKYAALGLWYPADEIERFERDGSVNDREPMIQQCARTLVQSRMVEFLNYLYEKRAVDWEARAKEMFEAF